MDVSRRPAALSALDRGSRSGRAPEAEAPEGDGHSEMTTWKSTKAAKTLEPIKADSWRNRQSSALSAAAVSAEGAVEATAAVDARRLDG